MNTHTLTLTVLLAGLAGGRLNTPSKPRPRPRPRPGRGWDDLIGGPTRFSPF